MFLIAGCRSAPLGTTNLTFENDVFAGQDSSYTNGIGLSWVSCTIGPSDGVATSVVEAADWLPGLADPERHRHLGLQLSQAMFTPVDIKTSNPPSTDRPYAGVLALDTSVYAADADSLHAWTLKAGVVGPSSLAGDTQRRIHEVLGAAEPQGWYHQLRDEPILNLGYGYAQRLLAGRSGRLEFDLTPNFSAALGNYATFANAGATVRLGRNLPASYGSPSIRAGTNSNAVLLEPLDADFGFHFMLGVQGFAAAHFLPQDGNSWRSSRSVETEDWIGSVSAGIGFHYRRLLVSLTFSRFTDTFVGQQDHFEYGSITMTVLPTR